MKTEFSDEWKQEIRRRCREIDEGAVRLVEAEEAFAKAYARLARHPTPMTGSAGNEDGSSQSGEL